MENKKYVLGCELGGLVSVGNTMIFRHCTSTFSLLGRHTPSQIYKDLVHLLFNRNWHQNQIRSLCFMAVTLPVISSSSKCNLCFFFFLTTYFKILLWFICTDIGLIHYLIWQPNWARPSWLHLYLTNRSAHRDSSAITGLSSLRENSKDMSNYQGFHLFCPAAHFNVFILAAGVEAVLFPTDWSTLTAVAETQTLTLMN